MISRKCKGCQNTYSAETIDEMTKYFSFKDKDRAIYAYFCRPCKREYDRERHKKVIPTKLSEYRKFIRQETKKVIKSKYVCSVIGCGKNAEIHHFDYKDPLAVLPVCRVHHARIHHMNYLMEHSKETQ